MSQLERFLVLGIIAVTTAIALPMMPHSAQIPAVVSYRSAAAQEAAAIDCADGESTAANCDALLSGQQ